MHLTEMNANTRSESSDPADGNSIDYGKTTPRKDHQRRLQSVRNRGNKFPPSQLTGIKSDHRRTLGYKAARWFVNHVLTRPVHAPTVDSDDTWNPAQLRWDPDGPTYLTQEELLYSRTVSPQVNLNIGGEHHEVRWITLATIPNSRLGRLSLSNDPVEISNLCDNYSVTKNEFYFDRPARFFESILALYRTGHLHILDECCVLAFVEDLKYWGISEHLLESCCLQKYYQKKEHLEEEIQRINDVCLTQAEEENFGTGRCARIRKITWDLCEKPQSSMAARIFAFVSITFILLSIVGLNLSTIPSIRSNTNHTNVSTLTHEDPHIPNDQRLELLELVCIIWFTLEYFVRFMVAPNKCAFVKSPMNMIDLISILPFYFSKVFEVWLQSTVESLVSVRKVVQMFRILRILRIFKLARHSQGLQALGSTLAKSYKELGLLMLIVIIGVLLFSSLAYFVEKEDNNEQFSSIPSAFWWALITLTTVGYGDMTPKTILGKIVGSFCSIAGVLVIGLPIPIIVSNFEASYQDLVRKEKKLRQIEAIERLRIREQQKARFYTNLALKSGRSSMNSPGIDIVGKKRSGLSVVHSEPASEVDETESANQADMNTTAVSPFKQPLLDHRPTTSQSFCRSISDSPNA
ncbi:unnamed protein product [Calicophoron daubneyi]|uniref:BTB domain-containing protein n=1 Tax=Calicophoron daubneyi TaxID=300641 RepID=A0AAV2TSB6_CALDB